MTLGECQQKHVYSGVYYSGITHLSNANKMSYFVFVIYYTEVI